MNILMLTSETVPYSKSGGLADVVGSLSSSLVKMGHSVYVFMPLYSFIDTSNMKKTLSYSVPVLGGSEKVSIFEEEVNGVVYLGLSHPYFTKRKGIYGDTSFTPYPDNASRFLFLSRAASQYVLKSGLKLDILHSHDWTGGLSPFFFKKDGIKVKSVFTIHNLAYQGVFPPLDGALCGEALPEEAFVGFGNDKVLNMMASGIRLSDYVTTVSPTYSREILTPEYGCSLEWALKEKEDVLSGIINGIDLDEWNPEEDKYIDTHFSSSDLKGKSKLKREVQKEFGLEERDDIPLIGIISRLAEQKGFSELLLPSSSSSLSAILKNGKCQFAIIGTGDDRYTKSLLELSSSYKNLGVKIAFSVKLSHLVEAGCDYFLMPSKYEPCGLNQMYSLHYGTLPIVNKTGGLEDSVRDMEEKNGTGFVFSPLTKENIIKTVNRAIEFYSDKRKLTNARKRAMKEDLSWDKSAKEYEKIYKK